MPAAPKTGKIEDGYWVWPNGSKTHLRFIALAVRKMKPLPKGFYAAAAKANLPNLNQVVNKAKYLKLEDNVVKP